MPAMARLCAVLAKTMPETAHLTLCSQNPCRSAKRLWQSSQAVAGPPKLILTRGCDCVWTREMAFSNHTRRGCDKPDAQGQPIPISSQDDMIPLLPGSSNPAKAAGNAMVCSTKACPPKPPRCSRDRLDDVASGPDGPEAQQRVLRRRHRLKVNGGKPAGFPPFAFCRPRHRGKSPATSVDAGADRVGPMNAGPVKTRRCAPDAVGARVYNGRAC